MIIWNVKLCEVGTYEKDFTVHPNAPEKCHFYMPWCLLCLTTISNSVGWRSAWRRMAKCFSVSSSETPLQEFFRGCKWSKMEIMKFNTNIPKMIFTWKGPLKDRKKVLWQKKFEKYQAEAAAVSVVKFRRSCVTSHAGHIGRNQGTLLISSCSFCQISELSKVKMSNWLKEKICDFLRNQNSL